MIQQLDIAQMLRMDATRPRRLKCEIYNDNFQNFKKYGIPKAQLVIADAVWEVISMADLKIDIPVNMVVDEATADACFAILRISGRLDKYYKEILRNWNDTYCNGCHECELGKGSRCELAAVELWMEKKVGDKYEID